VRINTLNFHGTLYGGTLMRWSEDSAALSARAFLDGAAVRCSGLHGLRFLRPVERDRFVHLRSLVVHTTPTSLTSLVSVHSENPIDGTRQDHLRALICYAPLEPAVRVAPLVCLSEAQRARFAEVERRIALERRIVAAADRAA
jgi:acyl-CoA hydrolase